MAVVPVGCSKSRRVSCRRQPGYAERLNKRVGSRDAIMRLVRAGPAAQSALNNGDMPRVADRPVYAGAVNHSDDGGVPGREGLRHYFL